MAVHKNQSPIHRPWNLDNLMPPWRLWNASKETLIIFRLVSSVSCRAIMWERMCWENVLQVSGDLTYVIEQLCSLSTGERHMNGHSNPGINTAADRRPSMPQGQVHYISWLIEAAFFTPPFFFKLGMLCWRGVFGSGQMRSFPELTAKAALLAQPYIWLKRSNVF